MYSLDTTERRQGQILPDHPDTIGSSPSIAVRRVVRRVSVATATFLAELIGLREDRNGR
jgi:hypothetical protein